VIPLALPAVGEVHVTKVAAEAVLTPAIRARAARILTGFNDMLVRGWLGEVTTPVDPSSWIRANFLKPGSIIS
jgi:hypothetical protein